MFHLIWYILIGLIAGVIAKSVMHVHMTIFWTIVLGIIGSIIGGGVTHMFSHPTNERYHPAGLILSTLSAIRQRNGELRMFKAKDVKAGTLANFIREHISEDVDVIMTDDFASYPFAIERTDIPRSRHQTINHSGRVYVMGNVHTNTVESAFSLLKRGVMGTWHKVSAKHLPAYLDEMCFRFNNRKNPYLFRDTIVKLIQSPNLEYKQLTSKPKESAA
jgi:uncharacterized membrane protein YeaQ/YmgE (transglycosylase-associated protein family)